jgi:hypothetical protein
MHWQDFIFTAGNIIFALALIPSILSKNKPAISTSLITGIMIYIFSLSYFSLTLWFSAIASFISGSLWLILALQKYLSLRGKPRPSA